MDTSSAIPTSVLGQTSATVSFHTNTLIAACEGAAWKISGWLDHVTICHAKGCACCHEYINHLLGAQSLSQINLLHSDIENAVQSAWPGFINSIETNADEWVQGQISNLHVQINEMKDALCDAKKSLRNAEAVLTKECSCVKDLEQKLKDIKSCLQTTANASLLLPMTIAIAGPSTWVVVPACVGAHMLICIYAQCQSKYISVFLSILFLYYFHFTVRTLFQFFPNFSLFFLPFYSLQKPVILTRHC